MGANLRTIRRKIRTVNSIWQITRAMEMVAASKLKRVQPRVEASREYMGRLDDIMASVGASSSGSLHPYLGEPGGGPPGLLVIGGEKGLCGSHNVNILRAADDYMAAIPGPVHVFCLGDKALDHGRRRGWSIVGQAGIPQLTGDSREALSIARAVRGLFDSGQVGSLHVAYTAFLSPMQRPPTVVQVLPVPRRETSEPALMANYIFEPEAVGLLASLLPRTVDARLVNLILQSMAAEQAARMTAMTAATENAEELSGTLSRALNRARQQQITNEILEVVSGANALQHG